MPPSTSNTTVKVVPLNANGQPTAGTLIIPNTIVSGRFSTANSIFQKLATHLKIPPVTQGTGANRNHWTSWHNMATNITHTKQKKIRNRALPRALRLNSGVKRMRYWCDAVTARYSGSTTVLQKPFLAPGDYDGETFNLISSLCTDGKHRPALDIDIPCYYVKSSTPGHGHLYFPELEMDWPTYCEFLKMLARFGVLETKYVDHSITNEQTLLRPPWITK